MRITRSVTVVSRHFADYINRVAFRRERFVLTRGNKPVAELRPVPIGARLGDLTDLFASLPGLSDAEMAAFAADLESARKELEKTMDRDPWDF